MLLGQADCRSHLARENGWAAAKVTGLRRLGRGDNSGCEDCNPSSRPFACETVKATGYLFHARTLIKLVTRSVVDPPMRSWLVL